MTSQRKFLVHVGLSTSNNLYLLSPMRVIVNSQDRPIMVVPKDLRYEASLVIDSNGEFDT